MTIVKLRAEAPFGVKNLAGIIEFLEEQQGHRPTRPECVPQKRSIPLKSLWSSQIETPIAAADLLAYFTNTREGNTTIALEGVVEVAYNPTQRFARVREEEGIKPLTYYGLDPFPERILK